VAVTKCLMTFSLGSYCIDDATRFNSIFSASNPHRQRCALLSLLVKPPTSRAYLFPPCAGLAASLHELGVDTTVACQGNTFSVSTRGLRSSMSRCIGNHDELVVHIRGPAHSRQHHPLVEMPNRASVLMLLARRIDSRSVVENAPTRRW